MLFESREGLEVTVEVGGGCGIVAEGSSGSLEIRLDSVNPIRLDSVILERHIDRDHDLILVGNLDGDDIVDRPMGGGMGPLQETNDSSDDRHDRDSDQQDLQGRQILFRSAEFFTDVE
jgi:hypothetical protein